MSEVTKQTILAELKRSMDDAANRASIAIALVSSGPQSRDHLLDIALDQSQPFVTRRWALKVASGFRDETVFAFIRSKCLAGKSKGQLSRALGDDEESHAQMALYVTGEEILNTPDFFERFVAKT